MEKHNGRRKRIKRKSTVYIGPSVIQRILPQDLGFVDRTIPGNELLPEVDFLVGKKQLKQILEKVINNTWRNKDSRSAGCN